MKRLVLLSSFLSALITACASTPDTYYTLMPDISINRPVQSNSITRIIAIGPISIPASVDQAKLVITKGNHQMDIRENELWASPLKSELSAALIARLQAQLPETTVSEYHDAAAQEAQTRVLIDIKRFDLGPGPHTVLDAVWTIKEGEESLNRLGKSQIAINAEGTGFDQMARAQGKAIEQLAHVISNDLQHIPAP